MAWTKRFFFLPWQLHPRLVAAVGTTSRISQHPYGYHTDPVGQWVFPPVGDLYPNPPYYGSGSWLFVDRGWYDFNDVGVNIPAYAVTIEPDNVPLATSRIVVNTTFNPSDTYPRYEPTTVYDGSSATCVCLNGYVNAPVKSVKGPFFAGSAAYRPAFFSVYETVGITSLTGINFIMTNAGYPPPVPRAMWYRARSESAYIHNWGGWRKSCTSGLAPMVCYVLRPSTGAIVGWLFSMNLLGGYGPAGYGSAPPSLITGTFPGPTANILSAGSGYDFPNIWNVTGMQDGDLIVWEWWHGAIWGGGPTEDYAGQGAGPWVVSDSVELGGGLAGQPFTFDGGNPAPTGTVPDWAPSQGSRAQLTTMSGIEPSYISSVRTTAIGASLGFASDSTTLTVVN
jgi:hypothetical protein